MTTHRVLVAVLAAALTIGVGARADALVCYHDSDQDKTKTGIPISWTGTAIDYYIYYPSTGGKLPKGKAAAIAAVQAAFKAWDGLACTKLKFSYKGELKSFVSSKKGAILVYFGHDATTWIHTQANAYYYTGNWKDVKTGALEEAVIGMNTLHYTYTVGAAQNAIDIQTAVMQMIPGALGFYVGKYPQSGRLSLLYNSVDKAISADQKKGAQFVYFKAGAACTKPTDVKPCDGEKDALLPDGGSGPPPDAGVTADAASGSIDGGGGGSADDGGCDCSVGGDPLPHPLAFLLLGLVALRWVRRRS